MIKAIETQYKGYRFRSRLEARWAVFFDALGLRWEYEPEGYDLGEAGWYLPDFLVHNKRGNLAVWFEIKPRQPPTEDVFVKSEALMMQNEEKRPVYIIFGIPFEEYIFINNIEIQRFLANMKKRAISDGGLKDVQGALNRYASLMIWKMLTTQKENFEWSDLEERWFTDFVADAYTAARSARFEHGEIPDRTKNRTEIRDFTGKVAAYLSIEGKTK